MLNKLGRGLSSGCRATNNAEAGYLDDVISSACCDLDATIADSFTSGQTWANLIASPADSAAQADYDFHLGANNTATTDDPTFTGTAGNAAAYFSHDGGDYFTAKTFSAAPTLYNMHKSGTSGQQWWVAIAGRFIGTNNKSWWGSSWLSGDIGFYWYSRPLNHSLYRGQSGSLDLAVSYGGAELDFTSGDDVLLIVSADTTATTNNIRAWSNSTTPVIDSFNFGNNNETANNIFRIGATDSGSPTSFIANTSRVYHFSAGNEFLTDAKAADIFDHLETRHSRTYI